MAKEFKLDRRVTLKNHSIEGGHAGPSQFMTVPAGTSDELAALPRRVGSLAWDETLQQVVYDDGSGFGPIADGSGMALDFSNAEPSAVDIDLDGNKLVNVGAPVDPDDATNKSYVDTEISANITTVNGLDGAVVLAAGTNITLTPVGQTITIDASGGSPTGDNDSLSYFNASGNLDSNATAKFNDTTNSMAFGAEASGGILDSAGNGSLARGVAQDTNSLVQATGDGSHAFGNAINEGILQAVGIGSQASGYVEAATSVIAASAAGALAHGSVLDGATLDATATASHAFGAVTNTGGTGVTAIRSSGVASQAFGGAATDGIVTSQGAGSQAHGVAEDLNSAIMSSSVGSHAHGVVNTGGSIGSTGGGSLAYGSSTGSAVISTNGAGAAAHGSSDGSASTLSAGADGTHSHGKVQSGGTIEASGVGASAHGDSNPGSISASGVGSKAAGEVNNASSSITASGIGSFAQGQGTGGGDIVASGIAAMARGKADVGSQILASGSASISAGLAEGSAQGVQATATGSMAHGYANGSGSEISASSQGGFAGGSASGSSRVVSAQAIGALAHGSASGGNIISGGNGSVAFGDASAGTISATGTASLALGDNVVTNASYSAVIGLGHNNDSYATVTIGRFAPIPGGDPGSWVSTEPLLVLGNGANSGSRDTAFQVDKDGKITEKGAKIFPIRELSSTDSLSARTDQKIIMNDTLAGTNTIQFPPGENGLSYQFALATTNTGTWQFIPDGTDVFINDNPGSYPGQSVISLTYWNGVWYIL